MLDRSGHATHPVSLRRVRYSVQRTAEHGGNIAELGLHNDFAPREPPDCMVETKTLLKAAGIVVVAVFLLRFALWLLGVVIGVVFWGIQLALSLLFVGLLLYGVYWAYTSLVSDSNSSSRERETLFER